MIARMVLILLTLVPFCAPLQGAFFKSKTIKVVPPAIKLLVVHDRPGVVVEVKGKYKIFDPNTNSHISTRFIGKRKFIQTVKDGLKWGEEFPGVYQLKIVPDTNQSTTIVDGIEYKGAIYVYDIGGSISIVNEIAIDEYLNSLLAHQYADAQLSEEALAALVITARTNAYYASQNPPSKFWALEASNVGYQGFAVSVPGSKLEKAIDMTRNMVLTKEEDKTPGFPARWPSEAGESQSAIASITIPEADSMAKNGAHAAQILSKAFPKTTIKLIQ